MVGKVFTGVRYREHPTRKHGIMPDRYFSIRYQSAGSRKEEGLGWASERMTAEKAVLELATIKQAARKGSGEARLSEKRAANRKVDQEAPAATPTSGQPHYPLPVVPRTTDKHK